jgi:hypothetical protein
VNGNGDDTFYVKRSGMFPDPTIDDDISMQQFFISNLASIPIVEDMTNHEIGDKGLRFWALLHYADACLDPGITCTEKYSSDISELYIKLLFCVGVPLDKFKELMQHPQATTYPVWLPGAVWQMANTYRTNFQNMALPYWKMLGSGKTWCDAFDCVVLHIWHGYATKSNTAEEKKGKTGHALCTLLQLSKS